MRTVRRTPVDGRTRAIRVPGRLRALVSLRVVLAAVSLIAVSLAGSACATTDAPSEPSSMSDTTVAPQPAPLPTVAVTYSVLASVVRELVDGLANVVTIVPDGVDPHDFEPSARDIETLTNADFVVANGLHFESGLDSSLEQLRISGRPIFYAIDHVTARLVSGDGGKEDGQEHSGDGNVDESGTDAHDHGTVDVHLWTSPATLVDMVAPLAAELGAALNLDLTAAGAALTASLDALDSEILDVMATIPACELVTGHNELGYFAERYGCELIGTVIPSSTTSAEASAGQLVELKKVIAERSAKVIFTSLGTPRAVADQIARESGVTVVELSTHVMGDAVSYGDFMRRLATTIAGALG